MGPSRYLSVFKQERTPGDGTGVGGFPEACVQPAAISSCPCTPAPRSCRLAHLLPPSTQSLLTLPTQKLTAFITGSAPSHCGAAPPLERAGTTLSSLFPRLQEGGETEGQKGLESLINNVQMPGPQARAWRPPQPGALEPTSQCWTPCPSQTLRFPPQGFCSMIWTPGQDAVDLRVSATPGA